MRSVAERLRRLERRPQNQIPRFTAAFGDGHTEILWGAEVLRYGKESGVKRIIFDGQHQNAVDTIALYELLYDGVEVVEK